MVGWFFGLFSKDTNAEPLILILLKNVWARYRIAHRALDYCTDIP